MFVQKTKNYETEVSSWLRWAPEWTEYSAKYILNITTLYNKIIPYHVFNPEQVLNRNLTGDSDRMYDKTYHLKQT